MTVIIPTFQLSATAHMGRVALKVANLEKMTRFYQEVIGLQVLEQNEKQSTLGVDNTVLLELHKVQNPLPITPKTGLYHVAFLLPTRKDLGNALRHYLTIEAPLIGASGMATLFLTKIIRCCECCGVMAPIALDNEHPRI